jgi:hypothetical protein
VKQLGFFCLLCLSLCVSQIMAQAPTRYFWEGADLSIPIPTGWADPVPLEQEGAPVLLLRPTLLGSDTTQNISIEFKVVSDENELQATLQAEFDRRGVTMAVSHGLIGFDGGNAVEGFGLNAEENLYLRIHVDEQLDGRFIVVTASGPIDQLDEINSTFLQIIGATSDPGNEAGVPTFPPYGILWERSSTGADAEQAFIEPQVLAADAQHVYVADLLNGILAFDALTGEFLWNQRVTPEAQITALTVDANGALYAADTGSCACLYRVTQASVDVIADGFGSGSPQSIAARADGTVLATDIGGDGSVRVRVIGANGASGEQESLIFETPLSAQPLLLTAPDQTVYAIAETNMWLRQEGAGFSDIAILGIPVVMGERYAVIDENGVLTTFDFNDIYAIDATGHATLISDPRYPLFPSPDTTVVGVDIAPDGTLFTLERSPDGARLAAHSRTITERLIPNRPITASLRAGAQNVSLIAGQEGDVIDLTVAPINADESFLMTLRLINAEGEVLGERVISANPEPHVSITLDQAGLYFLVAQNDNSIDQSYELGYRVPLLLTGGDQTVTGTLSPALPIQRWRLEAQAGQTITAQVSPISGDLDPSLRLVNPRGDEVELNEDIDPALGFDAGLTEIRLSNNGAYMLEVIAASGSGGYQLTIDVED